MKGEVLFEKMTGISDEFIAEAALVAPAGVAAPGKKPFASLPRALNSGWGVACICFIVAIAAVVGMVAWGRMGEAVGPGSDPSVRFAFSYEMTANDGSAWSGTAMPGDIVNVSTTIVNHGKPFKAYDFFAFAQLVLQEDESVVIAGHYPVVDTDKHTVESGSTGSRTFHFHIPENATPGVYDLVLSYDGEKQVFGGALTVGETAETYPPVEDGHPFSFGYEPFGGFAIPGDRISIACQTVNEGAAFTFTGYPDTYAPVAYLIHSETGDMIRGNPAPVDYEERETITVNAGEIAGKATCLFSIPADAPAGDYDLVLSYGGQEQRFENVLTVRITDSTEPLSNEQLIQAAENLLSLLTPDEADAYHYVSIADSCVVTESTATVRFFLHLGDVRTEQYIKIELSTEGVYRSHTVKSPEYAAFLPLVTNEMVEAAQKELFEKVNGSGQYEELFFTLNSDRELILYYEDFVYSESLGSIAPRNYSVTVCSAPSFSLTVELPEGVALTQSLSETYRMCDTVSLQLSGKDHVGYVGYINGKPALIPRGTRFEFSMPAEDTVITVKEFPVKTAYGMDAEMIATYMVDNGVSTAEILHFYDSRSGYAAVMMNSDDISHQKEPWREFIHNAEFRYADSNRVLIYYARQFYTLQEAVNEGLLDSDSAIILVRKHKELFPENYARS